MDDSSWLRKVEKVGASVREALSNFRENVDDDASRFAMEKFSKRFSQAMKADSDSGRRGAILDKALGGDPSKWLAGNRREGAARSLFGMFAGLESIGSQGLEHMSEPLAVQAALTEWMRAYSTCLHRWGDPGPGARAEDVEAWRRCARTRKACEISLPLIARSWERALDSGGPSEALQAALASALAIGRRVEVPAEPLEALAAAFDACPLKFSAAAERRARTAAAQEGASALARHLARRAEAREIAGSAAPAMASRPARSL